MRKFMKSFSNNHLVKSGLIGLVINAPFGGLCSVALADNAAEPVVESAAVQKDADMNNKRMQTLEGSKSRWSGQLQFNYSGSTFNHPFSREAPNPGHSVPPPVVTLDGTFSARYRIDDKTTAGLGSGVTTQTPFQGPKNTSLADPYVDVAKSYKVGPIYNRSDLQFTVWTNHQYHSDYGYRQGVSLTNESFYEFPIGLTAGVALELDYNVFAEGDYPKDQQPLWDVAFDPYFEYSINDTFNLRSVIGIADYKNKDKLGTDRFYHPSVYQTFGLGIAATKSVFVYVYAKAYPYRNKPVAADNTLFGFSTIINLF